MDGPSNELRRIEALGNERPREMVIAHDVGTESGLQACFARDMRPSLNFMVNRSGRISARFCNRWGDVGVVAKEWKR